MLDRPRRLKRREASLYLEEEWGITRKETTLAKYAVVGGGPKFEKAGRTPLYTASNLDDWARSILSPLVRSTSELRKSVDDDSEPAEDTQQRAVADFANTRRSTSTRDAEQPSRLAGKLHKIGERER
jgi:hypothetical protein